MLQDTSIIITCPFSGIVDVIFQCSFLVTSSRSSVNISYRFYPTNIITAPISKNILLGLAIFRYFDNFYLYFNKRFHIPVKSIRLYW